MGAVIQDQDVLFYTVSGALRFAYEQVMYQICKTSSIGSTGATTGPRLTPHDLHAVAGMILSEVALLPHLERNMVIAFYSLDAEERKPAVAAIVTWLIQQQPTGIHHNRAYHDVIEMYCGRGPTVRGLAEDIGKGKSSVHEWKGKLFRQLDKPMLQAKQMMEAKLGAMLQIGTTFT